MKRNVILQIEDNIDMLLMGERMFSAAGYEYLTARTCEEGLEKVKSVAVDLIILDYILPDLNGVQFIHALTHVPEFTQKRIIPIVLLTAHPQISEDLQEYYHYGLRAVLHKPFGHRELVDVVDNILQQEQILHARLATAPPLAQPELPALLLQEDFQSALETIIRLANELKASSTFIEQQNMDIDAIITTSKRLLKLLEQPLSVSRMIEPTPLHP